MEWIRMGWTDGIAIYHYDMYLDHMLMSVYCVLSCPVIWILRILVTEVD